MVSSHEPDYLLNDDEFSALMEPEFAKAGRPQNASTRERVWNRLNKKSHKKSFWVAGSLLVAALALFMVNRPQEPEPDGLKSSDDSSSYELNLASGAGRIVLMSAHDAVQLTVKSQAAITFSIFAAGLQTAPQRLWVGQVLEAKQTAQIELPAAALAPYDRLCLLAGENALALENLERMVELLWTKLDDSHCLQIQ